MRTRTQKNLKRIISLALTFAMFCSLLPTIAFAEDQELIRFKNMQMSVLRNNDLISEYEYSTKDNVFNRSLALALDQTWVDLSYVISYSQPVQLKLYRMKTSAEDPDAEQDWDTDNPLYLDSFIDLTAPDFGAGTDEPFLGEFLGYLHGVRMLENIEEPYEEAKTLDFVNYHKMSPQEQAKAEADAASGRTAPITMDGGPDSYVFGFEGESYEHWKSEQGAAAYIIQPNEAAPVVPPVEEPPVVPPEEEQPVIPPEGETPVTPPEEEQPVTPPEEETPVTPPEEDPVTPPVEEDPVTPPEGPGETGTPADDETTPPAAGDGKTADPAAAGSTDEASAVFNDPSPEGEEPSDSGNDPATPPDAGQGTTPPPDTGNFEEPGSGEGNTGDVTDPTEGDGGSNVTPPEEEQPPAEQPPEEEQPPVVEPEQPPVEQPPEEAVPPVEEPIVPEAPVVHADGLAREEAVLLGGDRPSLFSANGLVTETTIQNHLLWDGSVADEGGANVRKPEYTPGRYVIVMQPVNPATAVYNSFLAFEVVESEDLSDTFQDITSYEELYALLLEICSTPDPVTLLNGSFSWNYTDFAMYGKQPLNFIRYYESRDAKTNHGLGYGWSTDYTVELQFNDLYAYAFMPRGGRLNFPLDFDGTYRPSGDYTLVETGDGYTMHVKSGRTWNFDSDGKLTSIVELDGSATECEYSGDKLVRISNDTGSFALSYSGENISSVTDSTGRSIRLSYDGDYLTAVENPDSDSLRYSYEDGYLTTVENFEGEVYVDNTYDDMGRVIHQYAVNIGTFDFSYDFDARHNVCTGTDGYLMEIWYDAMGRILRCKTAEGTESYDYNDYNQIISHTDREGNTTEFEYNRGDVGLNIV